MIQGLSTCVIQQINGYEIVKKNTFKKGKKQFEPLDIVYEPVLDESPIKCFFTNDLHLAFRSYIGKKV